MSETRLDITVSDSAQSVLDQLRLTGNAPDAAQDIERLSQWILARGAGIKGEGVTIKAKVGAVKATGTVTFTGDPSADETVTINGVAFTAKASGATGNQFNIGANVTAPAATLAAATNASNTAGIVNVVSASSAEGVVTLTSVVPGLVGNAITLAENMSNTTVSGSGRLTGGTDGTAYTLQRG